MIDGLRPYPAMKEFGVPWLGRVPEHWKIRRAKYSFREVDERSKTGDEELLSVSHKTGVTPRSQKNVTMFMAESYEGHKLCRPGDIVVNTMWAWMAAIGVSRYLGIVSSSYGVYRPRSSSEFEPRYLDYLLRMEVYRAEYVRSSRGITSSRLRLYPPDFVNVSFLQPPLEEQRLIVRFLDFHGSAIARAVQMKRKLIALLNEQKRIIAHRAVTRGILSNLQLKPSAINWLGDVPANWTISRVKTEFYCLNRRRIPLSSVERGAMTSRRYDYYGASGIIDRVDDYLFDDELLLIGEDGANLVLRNLPLAIIARGKFWVNNHAHILKPRRGDIRYLAALLEGINYLPWISGAAQPKLTQDRLMGIAIAVPAPDEQRAIADYMDSKTEYLRKIIGSTRAEIALLHEYRIRLIADGVTGKLDVRAAAAALPDTVEDAEAVDMSEEIVSEEEESDEEIQPDEAAA